MTVNSIATGSTASHQLQTLITAGAANKQGKGILSIKDTPSNQTLKPRGFDSNDSSKVSSDTLTLSAAPNKNNSEPSGVVNHVVVSYNQQGKMRTKFEDSRNNVVYQMPSEAAAKLEDQISTSSTFTNIKG